MIYSGPFRDRRDTFELWSTYPFGMRAVSRETRFWDVYLESREDVSREI